MKRLLLQVLLLLVVFQTANAQSFNANLGIKLQQRLDSLVTNFSYNTKGISASVYCPGQGVWKGVSGISYEGHPLTTNMTLGIASNSKLFVAVTMLRLAEDHILSLNDPLSKWIPTYANINPAITIRQLLNHTSGVSDPFFSTHLLDTLQKYPTRVYTPQEILTWVGPKVFDPGGGYTYSNINYILAGMVAKSATGNNMSKLIRDYILTPLQLDSTFYDIEEPEIGPLAHRWTGSLAVDLHDTSRISLNSAGGPAGSIFSTAGDIVQWYHALMSNQVLTENSFAELTTFASPGNYGLGLQKSTFFERTTWGHAGSTIGYKSRVVYDPCMQTTVCCLANADWAAVDGITLLLYELLIKNLPACPGAITGATTVSQGQNSVTYSVPAIANATSYSWTLPPGVTGTSSTNSITVNFEEFAFSGAIKVKGINNYGESAESSLRINVTHVLRDILPITNLSLPDGVTGCFNAIDTIIVAGEGITVDFLYGSSATFIAGQSIRLMPGFHAHSGSWMDAYITTNSTFCDGPTGAIVQNEPILKSGDLVRESVVGNERQMKIFPNPNKGNFTVELINVDNGEIIVVDMLGSIVYRNKLTATGVNNIDLGRMANGLYVVKISDGKELLTKKVLIKE
jgi:D-alanyl-D-alanine carboxypeptidase